MRESTMSILSYLPSLQMANSAYRKPVLLYSDLNAYARLIFCMPTFSLETS